MADPKPQDSVESRLDGWSNLLTGLGIQGRDPRVAFNYQTLALSPNDCEELYRGDDMAARIAEIVPFEETREWFDLLVDEDTDARDAMLEEWKRLNLTRQFFDARVWARVFGGAGILIGAVDGEDDAVEPLNVEGIQSIDWLTVLDSRELIAVNWYGDVAGPKYGEPQIYRVQPLTLDTAIANKVEDLEQNQQYSLVGEVSKGLIRYVHETRILRFNGERLTRRQERRQRGWGDSVFVRTAEEIRDFQSAFDGAMILLKDFAQGVYKLEGLASVIGGNQADVWRARLSALDMSRSVLKAIVLDAKDDFSRQATPIAGLADLLSKVEHRLAASAKIPAALLMGQSPAGLNATGDSDIRFFYDRIAASQRQEVIPPLEQLTKLLFLAKKGPTKGTEPEGWKIKARRLWQLDDVQTSQVRLNIATADEKMIQNGVLTPEEVAESRFGGDEYSVETQIDKDARVKMAKAMKAKPADPAAGKGKVPGVNTQRANLSEAAPPDGQQAKRK